MKRIGWLRRHLHSPRRIWRNLRFIREEKKILRDDRPDVLLAVNSFCYFSSLLAARKLGVPFVLYCEAPLEYEYSQFHSQFRTYQCFSRRIERMNVRRADQVVCVSEILKCYMINYGVPVDKMHVIPNGVDHERFKPGPKDAELMEKLRLAGKVVVGFVGSFNFFADTEAFADSLNHLCERHPDAQFLFVGKGPAGDRIEAALRQRGLAGRVIFTGAVPHDKVNRYLSIMDVVISPYRGDYLFYGSPLKLLEYMAAGKPALITALGQIKEVVHDGYNGMLFDWGDDEAMVRKLSQLISDADLRRRLGENARKTIESGWTWEIQVRKLEKVLRTAVETRRGR